MRLHCLCVCVWCQKPSCEWHSSYVSDSSSIIVKTKYFEPSQSFYLLSKLLRIVTRTLNANARLNVRWRTVVRTISMLILLMGAGWKRPKLNDFKWLAVTPNFMKIGQSNQEVMTWFEQSVEPKSEFGMSNILGDMSRVRCHHGMARRKTVGGRGGVRIYWISKLRTADKGWHFENSDMFCNQNFS